LPVLEVIRHAKFFPELIFPWQFEIGAIAGQQQVLPGIESVAFLPVISFDESVVQVDKCLGLYFVPGLAERLLAAKATMAEAQQKLRQFHAETFADVVKESEHDSHKIEDAFPVEKTVFRPVTLFEVIALKSMFHRFENGKSFFSSS
jgi:hypothetical protein